MFCARRIPFLTNEVGLAATRGSATLYFELFSSNDPFVFFSSRMLQLSREYRCRFFFSFVVGFHVLIRILLRLCYLSSPMDVSCLSYGRWVLLSGESSPFFTDTSYACSIALIIEEYWARKPRVRKEGGIVPLPSFCEAKQPSRRFRQLPRGMSK